MLRSMLAATISPPVGFMPATQPADSDPGRLRSYCHSARAFSAAGQRLA